MSRIQSKLIALVLMTILSIFEQSAYADFDTFTVNVPNAEGSYTGIIIKKTGDGYTGPQGEYYATFPSVAQLQTVYKTGTPTATVVTYTAPAPPQVTYQVQTEDEDTDFDSHPYYGPVYEPYVEEEYHPYRPIETEENTHLTFFEFKKKKKKSDDHPHTDNQAAPRHANPPPAQAPTPPSSTPPPGDGTHHHPHDVNGNNTPQAI